MGQFVTPPRLSGKHVLRVDIDGVTWEVGSNLSLEDIARMDRGEQWLQQLARKNGRPVRDGAP